MTSATEFIDEPDTIRNEAVDNGLLATDNRTTELVGETSHLTHATTDEIWNGMARAIVDYLEGLR